MTSSLRVARHTKRAPRNISPELILDSIIFYGVFGLLLLGPLAFGEVEPWSMFLLKGSAAGLFIVWAFRQFLSAEAAIGWNPLFAPMLAFAILVLMQLVAGRTAYRYATLSNALLYAAYGLLCFLAVQCLQKTSQIKILTIAFSAYGLGLAGFALVQGLSSNGKLYWLRTPHGGGWIYGPYVNHNHYAGLMEMLLPIPLVFSLTAHVRGRPRLLAALAAAIMSSTIFLSGSRGGMAAFGCEMIVLLAALIRQKSAERFPFRGGISLLVFVLISVGLLTWIGGHTLVDRLTSIHSAKNELSAGLRLQIDRDLIKMFPQRPLMGWGFGTFADVYPHFRSFYTSLYIDEAHNDYLQLLIETGATGFLIMIWFLWLVFRNASVKLRTWTTDINGAVALAALVGICGILVHSLVDFNLQVPANAAMFYVLCVIASMEPRFGPVHPRNRKHLGPTI